MKKTLVLLCALLLLTGCGGRPNKTFTPQKYFTRDFTLYHGDYEIEGRLTCNSYEDLVFTFTHPAALTHAAVRASSAGFTCNVGGIADALAADLLPDDAPLKLFAAAVRESVFPARDFSFDGGDFVTELNFNGLPIRCRFAADGALLRIDCEAASTTVRFTEPTN